MSRDHHDDNYYQGRTFTLLLTLVNRDAAGACCSGNRNCVSDGGEVCTDTHPNSMLLFEGQRVLHRTESLRQGERRVVCSMFFCADPSQSNLQRIGRRLKDTFFFGYRALLS